MTQFIKISPVKLDLHNPVVLINIIIFSNLGIHDYIRLCFTGVEFRQEKEPGKLLVWDCFLVQKLNVMTRAFHKVCIN